MYMQVVRHVTSLVFGGNPKRGPPVWGPSTSPTITSHEMENLRITTSTAEADGEDGYEASARYHETMVSHKITIKRSPMTGKEPG